MDLNSDLGEGFGIWRLGDDETLLQIQHLVGCMKSPGANNPGAFHIRVISTPHGFTYRISHLMIVIGNHKPQVMMMRKISLPQFIPGFARTVLPTPLSSLGCDNGMY